MATGLIAAHEAGVVHRDLKPANIMVDEDDHAVIMDFGIARSTSSSTAFAMTVGAQVIGTVEYMSPEQARAETVDQRADLYAFGLILRDMLLGGRHAGATSGVTEMMARMQQPPASVRSIDATIPEAVDALITRCLQPDLANRYQTSTELLRDLERVAEGGTVAIAPHSRHVVSVRSTCPSVDRCRVPVGRGGAGRLAPARSMGRPSAATAAGDGRPRRHARDPAVPECIGRSDA